MNTVQMELVLIAISATVAFFIARAARQATTRSAAFVSIVVSILIVIVDRAIWANTERGIVDHLTCHMSPNSVACRREAEVPAVVPSAGDGASQPVEANQSSAPATSNGTSGAEPPSHPPAPPFRPLEVVKGDWTVMPLGMFDDVSPCNNEDTLRIDVIGTRLIIKTGPQSFVSNEPQSWNEEGSLNILMVIGGNITVRRGDLNMEIVVEENQRYISILQGSGANRGFTMFRRCQLRGPA